MVDFGGIWRLEELWYVWLSMSYLWKDSLSVIYSFSVRLHLKKLILSPFGVDMPAMDFGVRRMPVYTFERDEPIFAYFLTYLLK